jgi:hypothetical protein
MDGEDLKRFWDEALERLKIQAERATRRAPKDIERECDTRRSANGYK